MLVQGLGFEYKAPSLEGTMREGPLSCELFGSKLCISRSNLGCAEQDGGSGLSPPLGAVCWGECVCVCVCVLGGVIKELFLAKKRLW